MELETYLTHIRNGEIPPEPPDHLSFDGWSDTLIFSSQVRYLDYIYARQECIRLGLWTVIDQIWTKVLAKWIGHRAVLEVMAGAGFLAKALDEQGVKITATDDFSWPRQHANMKLVYQVQQTDAIRAARTIKADILLISWPPYGDDTIIDTCQVWGEDKPIIYIGEHDGGCNAPEEFFRHFQAIDDIPEIPLKSWDGLHDYVFIGQWAETGEAG